MKVSLRSITPNPIENIYLGYKVCVSSAPPEEIKIPSEAEMYEFIKLWQSRGHETPLEHVTVTFLIEGVSRALSHQLVRHRHTSPNQQSQRYVNMNPLFEFVVPPAIEGNAEAALLFIDTMHDISVAYNKLQTLLENEYMAHGNITPREAKIKACEDARFVLPNACTTNLIVTMNLRELRTIGRERLCLKAQWEIRDCVTKMFKEVKAHVPFVQEGLPKCKTCNEICKANPNNKISSV